jgi:hypothetical protein
VEKMIKLGAHVGYEYKDGTSIVDRAISGEKINFKRSMGALLCTHDEKLLKIVESKLQE